MLELIGVVNKNYCWVNVINFRYPDGTVKTVDRGRTEFTVSPDGTFYMFWYDCYFWDGEGATYLTPKDFEELKKCKIDSVEIEEDADADYDLKVKRFNVY